MSGGTEIKTQLVGLFVLLERPRVSLLGTKIYGMLASSQRTGKWVITSIGEMSPAMTKTLENIRRVWKKRTKRIKRISIEFPRKRIETYEFCA